MFTIEIEDGRGPPSKPSIYIYMLTMAVQTAGPNWLYFF